MRVSCVLFLLLAGLLGCDKASVDVTPPGVELLASTPTPGTGDVCGSPSQRLFRLAGGDTLRLTLRLTDNEALSQYKVEIHQNFDCHGHAGKVEDWSYLDLRDVSGTETEVSLAIPVPTDVSAGQYNYHYQLVDQAGNTTAYTEYYDLQVDNLTDTLAPRLRLDAPGAAHTQARETTLRLQGTLTDDQLLAPGEKGRLELTYQQPDNARRFTATSWPIEQAEASYAFDLAFDLPRTWPTGEYQFFLTGYDAVNNVSETRRFTLTLTR